MKAARSSTDAIAANNRCKCADRSACCRTRAACTRISAAEKTSATTASCTGCGVPSSIGPTEELIERLGLGAVAGRRAKGYSQGERLKVALARALMHRPQTIILDEPTNGLDVNAVRMLRELIRELRASGRCVLFSSHVMQEVAALCDDIVIISHGRVVVRGTPARDSGGHGRGGPGRSLRARRGPGSVAA